ncbi:MAG: hypothetical protein M1832_003184 [Thelocarpon impressellum]|nr:MAG: hypothetical protein M1832_003184 [Thelocarpon impressellum]
MRASSLALAVCFLSGSGALAAPGAVPDLQPAVTKGADATVRGPGSVDASSIGDINDTNVSWIAGYIDKQNVVNAEKTRLAEVRKKAPVPAQTEALTEPHWAPGLTCEAIIYPTNINNSLRASAAPKNVPYNATELNLSEGERGEREAAFRGTEDPTGTGPGWNIKWGETKCGDFIFHLDSTGGYESTQTCWRACHECLRAAAGKAAVEGSCLHAGEGEKRCRMWYKV